MKTPDQVKPNYAPVYAASMYTQMARLFVDNGWALAVHGSLARDLDLIAIPWVNDPTPREELLALLIKEFKCYDLTVTQEGGTPHPHGRTVYTIVGWGQWFIDLGFMPTITKE